MFAGKLARVIVVVRTRSISAQTVLLFMSCASAMLNCCAAFTYASNLTENINQNRGTCKVKPRIPPIPKSVVEKGLVLELGRIRDAGNVQDRDVLGERPCLAVHRGKLAHAESGQQSVSVSI